jgi:hypothetical protein
MKVPALVIMLVALYFLYRIAFPKQAAQKKDGDVSEKDDKTAYSVIGKSRFVLPDRSKPLQTPAISPEFENIEKKPYIFAPGNENRNAVIPNEKLDVVFDDEVNPDELDIEPDETENYIKGEIEDETADVDDEAAEMEQGAELASGMSIEEMTEAAKAIDSPSDEKAGILKYLLWRVAILKKALYLQLEKIENIYLK